MLGVSFVQFLTALLTVTKMYPKRTELVVYE